ncbi:MAG: serine/threonine-protein kinase [Gemmatimonadaceae bacterium]
MEDNPAVPGSEFAGRYTIERELGRGGAAIVFLARDNRQERQVALKVLHRELGQAIGARRFLREIKHSSSLQHPHLLSIHESGESDGLLYYVMPYMADGSLRTRIAKEKQLSVDEALRITRDVGEALSYAHSRGIVHRDIKPDNVLFSADHACLADFGIARAVDSVAADTLTSTGLVVGTPAYMSPEQASGEKEVDARSDQYSLACLLYEMITGLPPFIGATMQSVISQRFTQPPPSMRAHRPTVPDHVERAVKRALAVVPADRFPGVTDFIAALHDASAVAEPVSAHSIRRRWFGVGAAAAVVTLAVIAAKPGADWMRGAFEAQVDTSKFVVLPFLSDPDSTGARVANAIHAGLDRWEGLVLERDLAVRDAMREHGRVTSLGQAYEIAERLGAGRLVWGDVSHDGSRMTIKADLYDVSSRRELGEQRRFSLPDGAVTDSALFRFAAAILADEAIPEGMDGGEGGTSSYGAWQAYRLGAAALSDWRLAEADSLLAQAVAADRDFGIAQYWAARIGSWLRPDAVKSWGANAARAVTLKHELSAVDARRADALLAFSRGEYPRACEHYQFLAAQDTTDASAWYGLGECLHADSVVMPSRVRGERYQFRSSWHRAGATFLRALELDPRMHAIPQFRRLRQLYPAETTRIRQGKVPGTATVYFAAYPELEADTLAFRPVPRSEFSSQFLSETRRSKQLQAVARNQRILLSLAATWATAYPLSHEAHFSHASVLEVASDLEGALASLARARKLPASEIEQLMAAEAEARVRLKNGDFITARLVADSALTRFAKVTPANWRQIAGLAGLTGKTGKLGEALAHYWEEFADVEDLDPAVAARAGELLAHATAGVCDASIPVMLGKLRSSIQSRVRPNLHAKVNERVGNSSATYTLPCAYGQSMATVDSGDGRIVAAQRMFARGDFAGARAELEAVARGRSQSRPGDVSVNLIARESRLRLALGDTNTAIAAVDATLEALETISAAVLSHPLENALLVRLMADRADLAARMGDLGPSRKWGAAVAALWAGAGPELQPTVNRMRRLAAASWMKMK